MSRKSTLARAARPGPAAAGEDTRERLVRTAETLLLRDGYCATRVDDVIARAGLSKGSFYHCFDSKEALALAALDRYYDDRVRRLAAGSYAAETDPLRRANGFLDHASNVAEDIWSAGCLLANLSTDAAGSSRTIATALKRRTSELRALLADVLSAYATADVPADELAEQFLVAVEGSIVLARIYDDRTYLRRAIEQFRRSLKTAGDRRRRG